MSLQALTDSAAQVYDSLTGTSHSTSLLGSSTSAVTTLFSRISALISLPLPFLSVLALPLFGSTTTSINLVLFYLTWSTLVWSSSPLRIELYGTIAVRIFAFLLPSLVSLAFDVFVPSLAESAKACGKSQLAGRSLDAQRLGRVTAWAVFNVAFTILLQALCEIVATRVLHVRSLLQVSTILPLPWTIAKHVILAYVLRGLMHYAVHRYALHHQQGSSSGNQLLGRLTQMHKTWAHSLQFPFALAAAYDHPLCYILAHWLPVYLPAIYLRMHVLSWLLFNLVISAESTFIYSGYYAVLPSAIILPGMARRVDAHYRTGGKGNYGHLGLMDWLCSTQSPTAEPDFGDDMQDEAEKRDVKRRVSGAVDNVADKVGDARRRLSSNTRQAQENAISEEESGDNSDHRKSTPPRDVQKPRKRGQTKRS